MILRESKSMIETSLPGEHIAFVNDVVGDESVLGLAEGDLCSMVSQHLHIWHVLVPRSLIERIGREGRREGRKEGRKQKQTRW